MKQLEEKTVKTILTPGQDPRMILAAKALFREGYAPASDGAADLVLCPPGWKEDKLADAAGQVLPGGILTAGSVTPSLAARCAARGIRAIGLLEDPAYRAANALATGEGTLADAIRLFPRVLAGERVLVLGYGACGSEIARLFAAAGCRVSVWSHPASLDRAARAGFPPAKAAELPQMALTVNTVPDPDFMPVLIGGLSPGSRFFQVASGPVPGEQALIDRGVVCYALPGLPGKYAPESEAKTILAVLRPALAAAPG